MNAVGKSITPALLALIFVGGAAAHSAAAPDLRASRTAGPLTVYADDSRGEVFYYGPGALALATAADGTPALHLLYTRYVGTAAGGDQGARVFRSVLSFTVVMDGPHAAALQQARSALIASGVPAAELRPLPIARIDAALVYTPIGAAAPQVLPDAELEPAGDADTAVDGAYWRRRTFEVGLDPQTAQLLWAAMEQGQVAMSVGYAFYARGLPPDRPLDVLRGSDEMVAALREKLNARAAAPAAATVLVHAGALAVTADRQRWPALFRRIDINASLPPAYGVLPVYCYDFNNELRPDLYEIDVDLEAEGLGGRRVLVRVVFRGDRPDVYVRTVRFPVAVRLDRPYRYRTRLVTRDGDITSGPWQSRDTWSEALIVAAGPAAVPDFAIQGDNR